MRCWPTVGLFLALMAGAQAANAEVGDRPFSDSGSGNAEVMLGFVAFNSPYLYGFIEQRDGLTCQACHAPYGPTGIAATFSFRFAPPSLRGIAERPPRADGRVFSSVEAFARHAIENEFEGPPADRRVIEALAAYLGTLPAVRPPETGDGSATDRLETRLDARGAAAVAIRRIDTDLAANDSELATFSLLTARYLLGEWARESPSCSGLALQASTSLAEVDDAIIAGRWSVAAARLAGVKPILQRVCVDR